MNTKTVSQLDSEGFFIGASVVNAGGIVDRVRVGLVNGGNITTGAVTIKYR